MRLRQIWSTGNCWRDFNKAHKVCATRATKYLVEITESVMLCWDWFDSCDDRAIKATRGLLTRHRQWHNKEKKCNRRLRSNRTLKMFERSASGLGFYLQLKSRVIFPSFKLPHASVCTAVQMSTVLNERLGILIKIQWHVPAEGGSIQICIKTPTTLPENDNQPPSQSTSAISRKCLS